MRLHAGKTFLLALLLLGSGRIFAQDDPVPAYKGHVNDFGGILQAGEIASLEQKLKNYEDSTSTQIAVVIENTLKGKTAYSRAMSFARGWGVGSKEKNNGVVLYLAINDNKEDRGYYTVTSQATQGKLTDGIVGQIERDYLVPNFRQKAYFAGIDQVTTAYMQALSGEFKASAKRGKDSLPGWVIFIIILGIIFFISIFNNSRYGRGYRRGGVYWFPGSWGGGGSGWSGGGSSGGGWGGFGGGGGFDGGGAGGNW